MGGAWGVGQAYHNLALFLVLDVPVRMVAVLHAAHQLAEHVGLLEIELGNITLLAMVDAQIALLTCGRLEVMQVGVVCEPCPYFTC
jgi:hypothetical protein